MELSLPKCLSKRPFSMAEALRAGLTRRNLHMLEESGKVEKIAWGTYQVASSDLSEFHQFQIALSLVGKPSAICLLSALSFHGLTDLIPKKVWVLVPNSKRKSNRSLRLVRARNPQWTHGIEQIDGVPITSIERTLIDSFCYHTLLGRTEAVAALKKAIQSKKTTPNKIWGLATKMKVQKRILPYIEMLL